MLQHFLHHTCNYCLLFIWLKNRWCWGENFKKCHNVLSWYSHKHHLWGSCCTTSFWSGLDFQQQIYSGRWEVKLFINLCLFIYLCMYVCIYLFIYLFIHSLVFIYLVPFLQCCYYCSFDHYCNKVFYQQGYCTCEIILYNLPCVGGVLGNWSWGKPHFLKLRVAKAVK